MIQKYWINLWKNIGFSLPSSRFLARRMVSFIEHSEPQVIIELGGGKGILTAELEKKYRGTSTQIHVFEIEPHAVLILQERFSASPNIIVHNMSAAHISEVIPQAQVVISTLPLGSISPEGVDHILQAIDRVLCVGGQYIQYQYWMVNRKDVAKYFDIRSIAFEPRNWGPAFIYRTYSKKK